MACRATGGWPRSIHAPSSRSGAKGGSVSVPQPFTIDIPQGGTAHIDTSAFPVFTDLAAGRVSGRVTRRSELYTQGTDYDRGPAPYR